MEFKDYLLVHLQDHQAGIVLAYKKNNQADLILWKVLLFLYRYEVPSIRFQIFRMGTFIDSTHMKL